MNLNSECSSTDFVFEQMPSKPGMEQLVSKHELRVVSCVNLRNQPSEEHLYNKHACILFIEAVRQEDFVDYCKPEEYPPEKIVTLVEYNPTGEINSSINLDIPQNGDLQLVVGGSILVLKGTFKSSDEPTMYITKDSCKITFATDEYNQHKKLTKAQLLHQEKVKRPTYYQIDPDSDEEDKL